MILKRQVHYPASTLRALLHEIAEGRKTGNLTINFSQGSASGMLNWRERENRDLTSSELSVSTESVTANCR